MNVLYVLEHPCRSDVKFVGAEIIPEPMVDAFNESLCKWSADFSASACFLKFCTQTAKQWQKCPDVTSDILVSLKYIQDVGKELVDVDVLCDECDVCGNESLDAQKVHESVKIVVALIQVSFQPLHRIVEAIPSCRIWELK